MHTEVKGLVLRTVKIKESDVLLTLFTEEHGIVTALSRGAKSLKSRNMPASQQFCYASFVLYGQSDKYWVKESSVIESFYSIRDSIEGLALATYIAEVLLDVGVEEQERELLRLALNSLYAISKGRHSLAKIKAVFEMRCASILGFMPEISACRTCGRTDGDFFLDVMAGAIQCRDCRDNRTDGSATLSEEHESHIVSILSEGARIAMEYSVRAPLDRLFSFNLSDEDMRFFAAASEKYVINHFDKNYKSLEFYNEVKR